jgi:hypothetical protein
MKTVRPFVIGCILSLGLGFPGCVERREHLVISPDASVLWQVRHRSDSIEDLLNGDAVPTVAGGWFVEQGQERDDDGKVTYTLSAEAVYSAKRHRFPEGFGTPADTANGVCLNFTTSVTFEKRRDGTYCHFARRYSPREWAVFRQIRQQMVDGPLGSFNAEPAQWTPDQRLAITRALAGYEVEKALVFARNAWISALPRQPQDGYLVIRDDLHAFLSTLDYQRLANLLIPPQDAAAEQALTKAVELETLQLKAALSDRLGDAAQNLAGLDGAQSQALLGAFDTERRRFEATEDLNDDGFEITIDMPGPIVASNADQWNGGTRGNSATFKFKGETLHDSAIELLVTSRVND